jgi:phosphatidylcholine synthase
VVDYVTCVIVPVAFLASVDLLPNNLEAALIALILLTSALWFARRDQETEDHWFNGFPGSWNIVIPSFILLEVSSNEIIFYTLVFSLLSLSNFKVPHLTRVKFLRAFTLPFSIVYLLNLTFLSWNYGVDINSNSKMMAQSVLLIFPAYILLISGYRTFAKKFK